MDNFFKTVLTSSMGNDLQVGAVRGGSSAGKLHKHTGPRPLVCMVVVSDLQALVAAHMHGLLLLFT